MLNRTLIRGETMKRMGRKGKVFAITTDLYPPIGNQYKKVESDW